MNTELIPSPDTIPVNWWWFQILLLVTFLLHILLMNFILGGSLLTLWDILRGRKASKDSKSIPTLVALTVNFGIPPLLFIQVLYGNFFYTSSVLMALAWILVIPVLILAYYAAYIYSEKMEKAPLWGKISLSISALFLLYIAFILVNNSTLAITPDRWSEYFTHSGGTFLNWGEKTLIPRYLHMVIGAIAIAGLGKAIYYFFSRKADEETKKYEIKRGLRTFGWFSIVQIIIGLWFLLTLPKDIMMLFMGRNLAYTILLAAGILLGLLILHSAFTGRTRLAALFGLLTVVVMIVVRDLVRHAYLGDIFKPSDLVLAKQASPLAAFLIIFTIGLLSIYYMINLIIKPSIEKS
jgi:hypothetical protein